MSLTVLHLSTYGADGGGAGRAAEALHRAQQANGVDSTLRTAHGPRFALASRADKALWRLQKSPTATWRSPARFGSLSASHINSSNADVVNLHWVTNGFLSIEEIGKITKPLVWSLYDMWAFCGTEHYGVDSPSARWRAGYTKANRPTDESGIDLDRDAWQRKNRLWHRAQVVPASTWLTEATRQSALMGTWPITRIPHVIDTDAFTPISRDVARAKLGLDPDVPMILFLSSAGIHDARKGFDLLESAMPSVVKAFSNVRVIVAGPKDETKTHAGGAPITWFGWASGNADLRDLYCAANIAAVPSREDNMPLTAMEAQTCSRAVVAFRIGGLTDIVDHHATGFLAATEDTDQFADGLIQALEDSLHETAWAEAARDRALQTWSPGVVVEQYKSVYEQALA